MDQQTKKNFNTSHVTVYLEQRLGHSVLSSYFNTSHVTVYHSAITCLRNFSRHFNTSHVTVYPAYKVVSIVIYAISIHLMLRFIITCLKLVYVHLQFQYISCYGLSDNSMLEIGTFALFQYISCYGLSNDFKPFLSWHLSSFPLFYVISTFFTSRL